MKHKNKTVTVNKTVTDTDTDNASVTAPDKLVVLTDNDTETASVRKRVNKLRKNQHKRVNKHKPKVIGVWEKIIKPKLEQITDWRREWRSVAWICNQLGIAQSCFYAEAKLHPEIGQAMIKAQIGMEDNGVARMADIFMGRAKKRETVVGIERGQRVDYVRERDYDAPERAGVWLLSVYMGLANRQQAPSFELSKEEYEKRLAMDFGHKEFVNLQERDEKVLGLTDEKVLGRITFEPKRFGEVKSDGGELAKGSEA